MLIIIINHHPEGTIFLSISQHLIMDNIEILKFEFEIRMVKRFSVSELGTIFVHSTG